MYFITLLKVEKTNPNIPMWTIGYFFDFSDAKVAIQTENIIFDENYNYAIIEEISQGLYAQASHSQLFVRNETNQFVECNVIPEKIKKLKTFALR